ncbi:MAG: hypothetical protein LBR36_03350 [Bacteroidales bacterium]|jgi:tetratricopeptide (TPR) repeat protein|nr:hypothetical protein [Bacteroidales bacterium]
MNKIVLTATAVAISLSAFAQSGRKDLGTAFSALSNGYLDKAKVAIDKCINYDDTKNDAKTWMYRGNIYLSIAGTKDKEYAKLCNNCAEVALEAYKKALELDREITVNMGITSPKQGIDYCSQLLVNEAIDKYDAKDYKEAYRLATLAFDANKNQTSQYIQGFTAETVGDVETAKKRYAELVKAKTNINTQPYTRMAAYYKEENDTAKALQTMKTGASVFLKDTLKKAIDTSNYTNFAVAYSVLLDWANLPEQATEIIQKVMEKFPTNYAALITYGTGLSEQKKYDDAEKYLLKALEVKPNDELALYNLGNCHYNHSADITKSLGSIANDDDYQKAKEEANAYLQKARPYLEKAYELNPTDKNTLIMLKNIYGRLNETEKYTEIDNKLKELK